MSDPAIQLLAYVGRGLGGTPETTLADKRGIKWERWAVRPVPPADAADIMRNNPGQFALVDTLPDAAKRFSIKADRLADLAASGKLRGAIYQKRGEEPQPVVILDEQTTAAIQAEHKRAAKAKDKE